MVNKEILLIIRFQLQVHQLLYIRTTMYHTVRYSTVYIGNAMGGPAL